jgi:hypothetical protein
MRKTILIILLSAVLIRFDCKGQDLLTQLYDLPATLIRSAPDFDVEVKYIFNLDSINDVLFVQAFARHPKSKEPHFHQFIYEIPLSELNAGSFLLVRKNVDNPELALKIMTTNSEARIIFYFISFDRLEFVQVCNTVGLGSWNYSAELESDLSGIITLLTERITNKAMSTDFSSNSKSMFVYQTENVIYDGQVHSDQELNSGYYFAGSLKNPSFYAGKKNLLSSNSALMKDLKSELKRLNVPKKNPIPVCINVDQTGKIESVFFLNQPSAVNRKVNLQNFKTFSPGNNGLQNVKTKNFLVVK